MEKYSENILAFAIQLLSFSGSREKSRGCNQNSTDHSGKYPKDDFGSHEFSDLLSGEIES